MNIENMTVEAAIANWVLLENTILEYTEQIDKWKNLYQGFKSGAFKARLTNLMIEYGIVRTEEEITISTLSEIEKSINRLEKDILNYKEQQEKLIRVDPKIEAYVILEKIIKN